MTLRTWKNVGISTLQQVKLETPILEFNELNIESWDLSRLNKTYVFLLSPLYSHLTTLQWISTINTYRIFAQCYDTLSLSNLALVYHNECYANRARVGFFS